MGSSKKTFSPRANLIISVGVAIAALIFFSFFNAQEPRQSDDSKNEANVKLGASQSLPSASTQQPQINTPKQTVQSSPLPEEAPSSQSSNQIAKQNLPNDLQAQLNSTPPALPDDLKRQLSAPPPELPEDLKAQLNAPPKELPDDIKKALSIPPRIVTIDEVNNPQGLPAPQQDSGNTEKH